GDTVKRGQILMEALTDKATMEVPAAFAGTIGELKANAGDQIKVGQVVLTYEPKGAAAASSAGPATRQLGAAVAAGDGAKAKTAPPATAAPPAKGRNGADAGVKAAPSVRLMARTLGIDLARVHGSGPQGRVLIQDLTQHIEPQTTAKTADRETLPFDYGKPGTRIKLAGVRKKIAEHMVHAKRTIPHYSYVDECDVTELVRLRDGLREASQHKGVRITYLPFVIKAVVAALKEIPLVNASLDESADEIVLHDRYHIGIAAATPAGLIVPVVHDADKKDVVQLAREVERLTSDARAGKTKLEDLRGGTFTITSVGNIGGLFATPIVNHPEVGILGVGKIVKRPVYDEHRQIQSADMVYLSFSFDHRVLDGAVGAAFGNAVSRRLRNPAVLLLPE